MTCIVGLETESGVLLGADTSASSRYMIRERSDPKVFRLKPKLAVAFTFSFRMGQLLRYELKVTAPTRKQDLDRWMATTFIPKVRTTFADGGFRKTDDGREEGGLFLVGLHDRLYTIGPDFQLGRHAEGYDAGGSGEEYALGALYATRNLTNSERRVRIALEAAARFSPTVSGPFLFQST